MRCAIEGCPGPGERPIGPFLVCPLHADTGVCVLYRDDLGRPGIRVDMTRFRFSQSSRSGRLMRAMLASVTTPPR